jgi:hypothetical protein
LCLRLGKPPSKRRCDMNQQAVAIIADYLSRRPMGRVVRVMKTGEDDYLMGVEDVRDGRVQLIHGTSDLEIWRTSFQEGRCNPPTGAICGVCDRIHTNRDFDGELFPNCLQCHVELVEVYAELQSRGGASDE